MELQMEYRWIALEYAELWMDGRITLYLRLVIEAKVTHARSTALDPKIFAPVRRNAPCATMNRHVSAKTRERVCGMVAYLTGTGCCAEGFGRSTFPAGAVWACAHSRQ